MRFRQAAIRSALQFVDLLLVPIGVVAVVSTLAGRRDQRLGDRLAGTLVVRSASLTMQSRAVGFPPLPGLRGLRRRRSTWATLGSERYEVLRSFLTRVSELTPAARQRARHPARPGLTAAVLGTAPPPTMHPEVFLASVAAAYQQRHGGPATWMWGPCGLVAGAAAHRRWCRVADAVAYLDHAATSPLRPEVAERCDAVRAEGLGNPSGAHRLARAARRRLDDAREEVAAVLGRRAGRGRLHERGHRGRQPRRAGFGRREHGARRHRAVLGGRAPRRARCRCDPSPAPWCGVDRFGRVDLDELAAGLIAGAGRVAVVSVMLANNETGVINDLAAVAAVIAERAAAHRCTPTPWLPLVGSSSTSAASPADLREHQRPQARRPGRDRRPRRRPRSGRCRPPARWRPGARSAQRHRRRRRCRRPRHGAAARCRRAGRGGRASRRAPRPVAGRSVRCRPGLVETVPHPAAGGPVANVPAVDVIAGTAHVCVPGVASEALLFLLDEARRVRVGGIVVRVGRPAGLARAGRDGRARRAGPWLAPVLARSHDHRRRHRRGPRRRRQRRGAPPGIGRRSDGGGVRVLVGMSGGVDSSVAAAVLRDEGHDVAGVTLKLWGGESDTGCCSVADVDDARWAADRLGLDHHVFNFGAEFDAPRRRALPRRPRRRPHAQPVRRVQPAREVRRAAAAGGRPRLRRGRHRSPRPRRRARRRHPPGRPGRRRGEGPELRGGDAGAGAAGAHPVPDRRHDQGRRATARRRSRPGDGHQARQPGGVLHPPGRGPRRVRRPAAGD